MGPRKKKWLIQGGVGASLFGAGLCGCIESGFLKHQPDVLWYQWAGWGTLSLVVTLFGLVLLIKAGRLEPDEHHKDT
ncbi:Hypothetical protein I595_303 [Croceitalea dokdonensis DOKDO 023]|uniref:Lipoprotein n=1 Tax=Croceitalea dokdonensis DOKDO 023 TaxID=1300341 RepID=A0A0P7AYT4_9FLAO|nr:hypothetical protein [Croceitalea dokdonensis]KPM33400.1 Hypothetical protein I595_303 [Croceitalea dokdonensis DOKDO 023]